MQASSSTGQALGAVASAWRNASEYRFAFNTGSGVRFQLALVPGGEAPPRNFEYCGSKSAEAFKITVDRLFSKAKQVFMWSLTFKDIPSVVEANERLRRLLNVLVQRHGLWGVRVLELHREHGVHYHLLIPRFFPYRVMRRIGTRCGFGRVHVVDRPKDSRYYMAKHFVKQQRCPALKNARLWAAFGGHHWEQQAGRRVLVRPFHCRIANLVINSREHEIFRALRRDHIAASGKKSNRLRYDENLILWHKAGEIFAQEISAGRKLFAGDELPGRGAAPLVFN